MTSLANEDLWTLKRGALDPVWWAINVLGWEPWKAQRVIMESVRDHSDTSVKSCHGTGKSAVAAVIVLWFLFTRFPSIVITTAPTLRQVRGILWKEIGARHARALYPLGGRLLTQELKLDRDWFAWGFTAPDYDPDRFQGFHEENILVVLDEAAGITKPIHDGVDGVLSSESARKLEIGNPTDPVSEFARSFKTPGISKVSVNAFETPNFTRFKIKERHMLDGSWERMIKGPLPAPYLITPHYVARMIAKHGVESIWYQARVRAKFPPASKDTLIPMAWIEAAQERELQPRDDDPHELGVDIGRGGDPSVIAERVGPRVRIIDRIHSADTMVVAGHIKRALDDTGASVAKIDVVGIGAGVYDRLNEAGYEVAPAGAGERSSDPEQYLNQRAEWHWGLRERFEDGDIDVDPRDEDLAEQASNVKWKPNSRGQVVIEPKEDMKKRIGRSPDDLDAVAIAFANLKRFAFA